MTFDDVCEIALAWPDVHVSTSFGTPALKVGNEALTRLKEDGDSLVIRYVEPDERDRLIEQDPRAFYFTDHYRTHSMVLVRLSQADPETVRALLFRTWERLVLPRAAR